MAGRKQKRERVGVDRMGRTPFYYACAEADLANIRALIEAGTATTSADDNGWTPLHFAAQANSAELVAMLLSTGAEVDPQDSQGNTPLQKAVFNCQGDGAVILLLRNAGADPYKENRHGVSPLKLARTIANFDIRQFFQDLP